MNEAQSQKRGEVAIALGLTVALLFFIVLLNALIGDPSHMDFAEFYAGGLIIRQGNASRLYDLDGQARIERQFLNGERALVNPHPPYESLLFAGLARLSYRKAYLLWGAMNAFFWLWFQHLLRPYAPVARRPFRYFLLCSIFFPLWVALLRGQTSVLLLLAFSLTYVCVKRGRDLLAGVFLGLGLIKFAVVLPFACICFVRSKWKMMAGLASAASVLGLLSLATVGPEGVRSYLQLLGAILKRPGDPAYGESFRSWGMPTVGGMFATLLTGRVSTAHIAALTAVTSIALVLFTAWRWRQQDRKGGENVSSLMFAAALVVSLVTAPHLYLHDLTLVLLAVVLVAGSSELVDKSPERVVLISAILILYAAPLYVLLVHWEMMYLLAPLLAAFALALISLAGKTTFPPGRETISHRNG